MVNVFVTGASGVLGKRLVERLADRGHRVYGLVRDESGAEIVAARGGTPRRGDVLDRASLERVVPDVDVLVHAATSIPTARKPSAAAWERNDRVRLDGVRNLVSVAGDRLERVLFPSVVWVARQPDGERFDETADRHPDRTSRSAAAVEDFLTGESDDGRFDVTLLRCGFFYAPDAAHTRQFGRSLLSRDFPIVGRGPLGRGDARLSFLHADDAARAFATAVDADVSGSYHVVDDRPTTLADFLTTLAGKLAAPAPRRLPAWLARFVIGAENAALLLKPMPTSNDRFTAATGWEPTYPNCENGLEQVASTWEADGTLRETDGGYAWTDG
ncbi:NAD-dependent epimerase/dehydratase family protein [Halorarum halobium]|uniref:NAD-dependent epimerase/dehydratase family protein n=1 Tax=Halorarum halobium TaxID=3075121 RepID=UPI0028AD175E|nr:NAD(P)-dependent oxidoreductase [Halobaculum sp. XH14]